MILFNNQLQDVDCFSEKIFENGLSIYEVIRIFEGYPIFLSDNLERLANSLKKSDIGLDLEELHLPDKIQAYIAHEGIREGNLKYVLHFSGAKTDEYLFRIPHSYPSEEDYRLGVPTATLAAERQNPEVKYINADLRTRTNRLISEKKVHEILLVDREGFITEGSRSNVFFIRGKVLYTCPVEYVLPGTSRKRVMDLCASLRVEVVEKRIAADSLSEYEAAFITGTSPLILPINRIDAIPFQAGLPFLQDLMRRYFNLLKQ